MYFYKSYAATFFHDLLFTFTTLVANLHLLYRRFLSKKRTQCHNNLPNVPSVQIVKILQIKKKKNDNKTMGESALKNPTRVAIIFVNFYLASNDMAFRGTQTVNVNVCWNGTSRK